MDKRKTIQLPDGYNGSTLPFYAEPIETDGQLVKLQCAAKGLEYMHRWARSADLNKPE